MIQRQYPNGVLCITSPLFEAAGIRHGFSTRVGGVSHGAFASLNFGNPMDSPIRDPDENLAENHRRLAEALKLPDHAMCRVHQVHGREIVTLRAGDPPARHQKADALMTDAPGLALSMRTADCVPILVASRAGHWVAAVHAGWRGIVAGVLPDTIHALRQHGVAANDLLVAIGPCIGPDHFEVGAEVADEFRRAFGDAAPVIERAGRKPHIDLASAAALQARDCGISTDQIDVAHLCTVSHPELFFSHRRDAGLTGRMTAIIATGDRE